jgi:signal transduction histidine kinase
LVAGGSVRVIATSTGEVRPLNLRTADTLYRIGQEALANAIRHAHPNTLSISLEYEKNAVRLSIGDDGVGFAPREDHRSFGVKGMLKRASSISAKLEISGEPGKGTIVSVTALLLPRITLTSWPIFLWKYLKEHTHNGKAPSKPYPYSDSR